MAAKQFLEGIRKMRMEIDFKKEKIVALEEIATNTSVHLTGMPHNPSSQKSPMANAVCKIVDLEREIEVLQRKRQAAIAILYEMDNSRFCAVLIKRYVQEKQWEDIAAELRCCRAHIFRMHTKAVEHLDNYLQKETK